MSIIDGTQYVTEENGVRPAGPPDACFYCKALLGGEHKPECVCILKMVTIRMTVEYPVKVPASWTKENIEFHRNEGTWCSDNALAELDALFGEDDQDCMCGVSRFELVDTVNGEQAP